MSDLDKIVYVADLIDELRERIRVLEDELHEYHMRERITISGLVSL